MRLAATLHRATELATLASHWDTVNATMGGMPFLRAEFIRHLLAEFGAGEERLAMCTVNGEPCVLTVVVPLRKGRWATFQPSQLPLGAWVMKPGVPWADALDALTGVLPGFPVTVGVTQQDPAMLPRPPDNNRIRTLDYVQTAWVKVDGLFDQYWNARGKNLRQNMRKQRNKLSEDGIDPQLEILSAPSDVAEAIRDYGRLESAGWKASGGTAVHPDNAQGRFYCAVLEAFCAEGRGRIYRYRFGDKVVAVDLCVESNETLVVLKTTYDENFKALSPALLMRQDAFREIFDSGRVRRIEFYGKLMEWHTRWTDEARTLYHLNYYRWGWLQRVRRLAIWMRGTPGAPSSASESTVVRRST